MLTFLGERDAAGFLARSVGRHFERQGAVRVLPVPVRVDLPPVGMMTMRARPNSATTAALMDDLRSAAQNVATA
ncbi:hypothetical protein [Ramlibacter sp.]|uniref:hypothetical protein n=1 Tax=Ramlibacter sp. TaxID=1917967 RepID=UPI002C010871|nr:hypothetical protein [Ramlibacter sp.]HWI82947.1 hypothetical protein [Ramlibacter sp.]